MTNDQSNNLRHVCISIAQHLLELIRPDMGGINSGDVVGEAKSGDYTFQIDETAEAALEQLVADAGKSAGLRLAYYSEDRGLVSAQGDPQYVLVIDPIDGTRPAVCGFESCCISIALAPINSDVVRLDEVEAACLIELKSGRVISAVKSGGVFVASISGQPEKNIGGSRLSKKSEIKHLFWAHEICARPYEATYAILGRLINDSSFGGGAFVFNSSSFAISRVVLGQLQAYVDPFAALLRTSEREKWVALSRKNFGGKVFGLFPYDIAAAAFIAQESGAIVTDAFGQSIGPTNLISSNEDSILSCVVAANKELSETILGYLNLPGKK